MRIYDLVNQEWTENGVNFDSFVSVGRQRTFFKVEMYVEGMLLDMAGTYIDHPVGDRVEETFKELKLRCEEALPYQIEKLERVLATLKKVQEVGDVK